MSCMTRQAIFEASVSYFLSPIGEFLEDETVTEVMVNRFDQVYVERAGQLYETDAQFESEDDLLSAVHNIAQWVGREINLEYPILDARLPDGSRVHAIIPPGCRAGTCLTIRKFTQGGLSLEDLIGFGSLSEEAREFLEICVRLRKNIVIAGGTGTGKTSLLGAVSAAVPEEERIVVIEDTSELKLRQQHCIYLEVQRPDQYGRGELTIRQLFVASLRMRPDRIIVGEVRGGEALDMVQAMLSGHSGSLTTVHANSAHDAVIRLETLSMMSDVEKLALAAAYDAGCQADAVWVFGDVGYNHGSFFSPAAYGELIRPDHMRLCDWAHQRGMKFIYHTDGDVRLLLDLFVEAGFDCIQPMEAKTGMDVRDLAPKYGRDFSFFGNIDMMVAATGDRDRIEHEMRTKLAAGMANWGYAYHSDHSVPPTVSWPTYQFIIELLDRHGDYA